MMVPNMALEARALGPVLLRLLLDKVSLTLDLLPKIVVCVEGTQVQRKC